jgi:hypothetical protein
MTIPRCAANADQAIEMIRDYHQRWLHDQASMKGRAGT